MHRLGTCLWFDRQAEDAAKFYVAIFENSKLGAITHYTEAGPREKGSVLTVDFELDGRPFTALNGGPEFKFTEAISLVIDCDTQAEVDDMWAKLLLEGGEPVQCGWLKDRFGVSWQIVPVALKRMLLDNDPVKVDRVMKEMLTQIKLDTARLQRAYDGA